MKARSPERCIDVTDVKVKGALSRSTTIEATNTIVKDVVPCPRWRKRPGLDIKPASTRPRITVEVSLRVPGRRAQVVLCAQRLYGCLVGCSPHGCVRLFVKSSLVQRCEISCDGILAMFIVSAEHSCPWNWGVFLGSWSPDSHVVLRARGWYGYAFSFQYVAIETLTFLKAPGPFWGSRGDGNGGRCVRSLCPPFTPYTRHCPLVPVQSQPTELPATIVWEWWRRHSL